MDKRIYKKEESIKRAERVHNNKYDYSKVVYNKTLDKVIIICPIHGDFIQVWNDHLRGGGCQKCSNERTPNTKLTTEEFINRSNKIHKNHYQYPKVNYINSSTKVIITCLKHGDFEQKPSEHLLGHGCNGCKSDRSKEYHKQKRELLYLSYSDASVYCIENGIKSGKQYTKYYNEQKPKFLPAYPPNIYEQWIDWGTFLKTGNPNTQIVSENYLSFNEAREFIQKLGLKTHEEYDKWYDENKPIFLPKAAHSYYKNNR